MDILITGSNGYIGKHLSKVLEGNITCLNRQVCNLSDSEALHEVAIALREHPLSHKILGRKEKSSGVNFADAEAYNQLLKNTIKKNYSRGGGVRSANY